MKPLEATGELAHYPAQDDQRTVSAERHCAEVGTQERGDDAKRTVTGSNKHGPAPLGVRSSAKNPTTPNQGDASPSTEPPNTIRALHRAPSGRGGSGGGMHSQSAIKPLRLGGANAGTRIV